MLRGDGVTGTSLGKSSGSHQCVLDSKTAAGCVCRVSVLDVFDMLQSCQWLSCVLTVVLFMQPQPYQFDFTYFSS